MSNRTRRPHRGAFFWLILGLSWALRVQTQAQSLVTYAGAAGQQQLLDVVRLSDGTCLVAGAAQDLSWLPATTPRTELAGAGGLRNGGSRARRIGFILHLSPDLTRVLRAVTLPAGAAESISRIKSTEVPGQPTGALFISGTTLDSRANGGGYFLARLDNNFVQGAPTALVWTYNVWAEGYVSRFQPWDVDGGGRVVFVLGQSLAADWCAAQALDGATGQPTAVPGWRTHWLLNGQEFRGVAADAPGGLAAVRYSAIVFKKTGRCDLRSWTAADYTLRQPDGNGRQRQGRWPVDAFFGGPCDPAAPTASGSGYTGYRTGPAATYGVSALSIDRRDGSVYVGFNVQTVLPTGEPDFEPAVLALAATGELRWWSRLYHEQTTGNQPLNSSPDQYVDGLAVDYAGGHLVVLARCHGNNVSNFWRGDQVVATPGAQGFQNQFTGSNGNIHVSWLGKLALPDGTLRRATYLGEYQDDMAGTGPASSDPNLDGWPSPNAGWARLNTTRGGVLRVGADGAVAVGIVGRRPITTRGAYQKMLRYSPTPNPAQGTGAGSWASFVRVYAPDLSTARYSSVLTGAWDPATGQGGGNTTLEAVWPEAGRVLAVGWQAADASTGQPQGNPVPTAAVPAWGRTTPVGQAALLASLPTGGGAGAGPLPVGLTGFEAARVAPARVRLRWTTATEENSAGFEVQRSPDGQAFRALGWVAGAGQSARPRAYAWLDSAAAGAAYYRLAQRDQDGTTTFSGVAYVPAAPEGAARPALQVWPNPATDAAQVLSAAPATGPLQLFNGLGQLCRRQELASAPQPTVLSLRGLPPGLYRLVLPTAAGVARAVVQVGQ